MGTAAAAAVVMHKEREIVDIYRRAAATAPDRARRPAELGIHNGVALSRLQTRAVLRESAPGQGDYYLDERSWEALRGMRRRLAGVVIVIAVVLILFGVVKVAR
jgi:hypothetical protein